LGAIVPASQSLPGVIRPYARTDLEAVLGCFWRSVREIGARAYTAEELAAWAPEAPDRASWRERLASGGRFVAEAEGRIAGFARIEASGWLDLLYVEPSCERRGVGRNLLAAAHAWAVRRGARTLACEASLAALPFFKAMGYRVEAEQLVQRRGVTLRNFRMTRTVEA
jgi:putative acetyltransferase